MAKSVIYGRNLVLEALKGERGVDKLLVQEGAGGSINKIISLAKEKGIRIDRVGKQELDKQTSNGSHQGVCCMVSSYEYVPLEEIVSKAEGNSVIVLLDEIEDPHNLGAIMRTAECAGVDGIVITKRRSVGLTETVAKTSAGAIEHMPCARVTNLSNAIEYLKSEGYWICGADMDGQDLWSCNLKGKLGIVIGNEGKGLSRLVRENCDFIASIPMVGKINSLNASNAAAILIYEAVRQSLK